MIRCPACAETYSLQVAACPRCGFSPQHVAGFLSWAPESALDGNGFKAEYFADLAKIEAENFWFRARNSLLVWALKKYFPDLRAFLEVGCGTGFVLSAVCDAFPSAIVAGTELFSEGLTFAALRVPNGQFSQMDGRRIPFEEEFDVVGAFDVLEHIDEDEAVLAGMYRAIKPGGGLLLTVPQHQWLWSSTDEYACHVRRYSAGELHLKIENAGFEILRSTSFVTLLLPIMWIARRRTCTGRNFDRLDEFRIPSWLNRTLESLLRAEQVWIRSGVSLPLGGSRLVVGRRSAK